MPFDGSRAVVASVLTKLGIHPRERFTEHDQDAEYTSCRADEIPSYIELYVGGTVTADERAVLCCFLLEGLNERIAAGEPHPRQTEIFDVLFAAGELHAAELAYWMDTSEPDEENWWPITAALLRHRGPRGETTPHSEACAITDHTASVSAIR